MKTTICGVIAGAALCMGAGVSHGATVLPEREALLVAPKGKTVSVTGLVLKNGQVAKENSTVSVTWNDQALIVVFENTDSAIAAEYAVKYSRDHEKIWKDDCVSLLLDPGHAHDGNKQIQLQISAATGLLDRRGKETFKYNIKGIQWTVDKTAKGWKASLTLPWEGLGMKPDVNEVWGMNLARIDHEGKTYANMKTMAWVPFTDTPEQVNRYGHILFAGSETAEADAVAAKAGMTKMHDELCRTTLYPNEENTLVLEGNKPATTSDFVLKCSGAAPTQETRASITLKDGILEVTVDCVDDSIAEIYTDRDALKMWKDDCVVLWLDPDHGHHLPAKVTMIQLSASGAIHDAVGTKSEVDIEGLTQSVNMTDTGWQGVIRLPLKSLTGKAPKAGDVLGFNLSRNDQSDPFEYCNSQYLTWISNSVRDDMNVDRWGHLIIADKPMRAEAVKAAIGKTHKRRIAELKQ